MTSSNRTASIFAITALGVFYATTSLAQTPPAVPAPFFEQYVGAGSSTPILDKGAGQASIQLGGCAPINPSGGCGTAFSSTGAFGPSANSSTIFSGGSSRLTVDASAQVDWQFEVIDSNNTAPLALYVPVIIRGLVTAATVGSNSTNNSAYMLQSASASISYSNKVYTVTSSTTSGNVPANGALLDSFTVGANVLNGFYILSSCDSELYGNPSGSSITGSCEASADPTITINPIFLAANPGLSLVFSPGITPGVVPIPATGWLLVSGLGALALVQRRRLVVENVHRQ